MNNRRTVFLGIGIVALVATIVVLASPIGRALFYFGAVESVFPSAISWDGKTAWQRCASAIDNRTTWPDAPRAACAAMHLCANEAPLTDGQKQLLVKTIRATPGCPLP